MKLSAQTIEYFGDKFKASGGVIVDNWPFQMKANEAIYSINPTSGRLLDVSLTSCKELKPHYHLRAKSISLSPFGTVRASKVSLFIGNNRLFTFPYLIFKIGSGGNTNSIFPFPGYSKSDGATLSYTFALVDNDRLNLLASPKYTTRKGMQGGVVADYGLNGGINGIDDRTLKYESLKEAAFYIKPAVLDKQTTLPIKKATLKATAKYMLTSEQNQLESETVSVFRKPEFSLRFTAKNITQINTNSIKNYIPHPNITLTYGNYRETPSEIGYLKKTMLEAEIPITVATIGTKSAISPFIAQRWSRYSDQSSYNVFSYGVDYFKMFNNGSLVNLRYLNRNANGNTPFAFDEVQVNNEIQSAFQIWKSNYVFGLASAYDIDRNSIYDWEIMAGKKLDCMTYAFRWNNRLKKFSVDLSLLGF